MNQSLRFENDYVTNANQLNKFKGLVENLQYKKVNEILVTLFDTKMRIFF